MLHYPFGRFSLSCSTLSTDHADLVSPAVHHRREGSSCYSVHVRHQPPRRLRISVRVCCRPAVAVDREAPERVHRHQNVAYISIDAVCVVSLTDIAKQGLLVELWQDSEIVFFCSVPWLAYGFHSLHHVLCWIAAVL